MGIYDRDYLRPDRGQRGMSAGSLGALGAWSGVTWMIVILAVLFVADAIAERIGTAGIAAWTYFSMDAAVFAAQVWRFITFPFIHATVGQLAINVLILFFFGPTVEWQLGTRRFVAFFVLCAVAPAIVYVLLWAMGILILSPALPLLGATGGVLGVLAAATLYTPDVDVPIVYIPFPVKLRAIVWIVLIGSVIVLLRGGMYAGAQAAHVGGVVCGFALTKWPGPLDWSSLRFSRRPAARSGRTRRTGKNWSGDRNR